jgi:co-chaperonin GroES (HSP10)
MIRPLKNQVLIQEIPGDPVSVGGIVVPDAFNFARVEMLVLAAGPTADAEIKPGRRVLVDNFRCMAKTAVAPHQFLLSDSSLAMVIL